MSGNSLRICFVGDSFVNGTGDLECLGWTGRACAAACARGHDVTHYNLGVRRETSRDIRGRWREEVVRRLPREFASAVVFSFGVNDTTLDGGRPRVALDETLENAREILREARVSRPVLLVGPPPIDDAEQNERIRATDLALARVVESLGVPFLSVFEQLASTQLWMSEVHGNDGAHPRAAGYAALASLFDASPAWRALFR